MTTTTTLIHELGRYAQLVEIELVDATHKAERGGKPGSRLPTNPGMLSDLEEAWTTVTLWTRDWLDFFDLHHGPDPTWPAVTTWLALHWPNAQDQHPAANDFYGELFHRHDKTCRTDADNPDKITCGTQAGHLWRLRTHLGIEDRPWKPLGVWTCPTLSPDDVTPCGGRLLVHHVERLIRCPRCGDRWEEADYERLGLILGCDPKPIPLTLAANRSGIPERTLRNWVTRGLIPGQRDGRTWLIDIRDVLALAARATEGN